MIQTDTAEPEVSPFLLHYSLATESLEAICQILPLGPQNVLQLVTHDTIHAT